VNTIERKQKIEELVGEVLMHVRADLTHAESNLRLLRRQSSDNNVDWFLGNITKQATLAAASLQVMLKQLDEKGLTTAELAAAVEERESFQEALESSPQVTPAMLQDWFGDNPSDGMAKYGDGGIEINPDLGAEYKSALGEHQKAQEEIAKARRFLDVESVVGYSNVSQCEETDEPHEIEALGDPSNPEEVSH
jgi:hypothetical protein